MTKKIGLGALTLLVLGAVYYYTVGSSQLIEEMKSQVHKELSTLKKNGFGVQEKPEDEKREHIVLSFNDPEKIARFLRHQGVQINKHDAQALKGLKLAIDLEYLPQSSSAFAMDIYPLSLPNSITEANLDETDKKLLAQLQQMINKKAILLHMEMNKLGTNLNGYMKDIDETFQAEEALHPSMHGFTFAGKMEENRLKSINQNLRDIGLQIGNKRDIKIVDLKSDYRITGATPYDYQVTYTIGKIAVKGKGGVTIEMDEITVDSLSKNKNDLLYTEAKSAAKSFHIRTKQETLRLENILFDIKADNIDAKAIELLQNTDMNNQAEIDRLLRQLISKGILFEIPLFSVAKISKNGQIMDGFELDAKFEIDKNFNLTALNANPMVAMEKITAHVNIALSNDLFALIAQQPQAMMALMLFQPKDMGKKKVYTIELKKGQMLVNGMPIQ